MPAGWIGALVTLIVQSIVAVYVYGKHSQSISDHAQRITRLEDEQDDQWTAINATSNRVAELHGKVK